MKIQSRASPSPPLFYCVHLPNLDVKYVGITLDQGEWEKSEAFMHKYQASCQYWPKGQSDGFGLLYIIRALHENIHPDLSSLWDDVRARQAGMVPGLLWGLAEDDPVVVLADGKKKKIKRSDWLQHLSVNNRAMDSSRMKKFVEVFLDAQRYFPTLPFPSAWFW
ncbi:hypothetical protein V490_01080 [Pseudogymnoascus sp. VKM F-3557]|nr:hypothetical protein V490_01080 [Pseudogymnoascus sp. VKM F-3557]